MLIPTSKYKEIQRLIPIVCVDVVIVHRNRCLLVKRDNEPARGQYWIPGGRLHKMESIKKAALRKAREEVNLRCSFIKIVSVEQTIFPDVLRFSSGLSKSRPLVSDFDPMPSAPCSMRSLHSVNVCCKLKPLSIKELRLDSLHSDLMWVNLAMAKKMSLHPAIMNPIKKCLS